MSNPIPDNESTDCVICHETFVDPRPLPCGHCYCGQPRNCLDALANAEGTLICAICRCDFNMRAQDIKPLYGIRDYFDAQGQASKNQNGVECKQHVSMDCNLWCLRCQIPVCDDCMENEHDEHPVKHLRKYLVHQIEQKLGNNIYDELTSHLKVLDETIEQQERMLPTLEDRVANIQSFLTEARKKRDAVSRYFENMDRLRSNETVKCDASLLLELSGIDFNISGTYHHNMCGRPVSVQTALLINDVASQTDDLASQEETSNATNSQTLVTKIIVLKCLFNYQYYQFETFTLQVHFANDFCEQHKWTDPFFSNQCLKLKWIWDDNPAKSQFHHLGRCRVEKIENAELIQTTDWCYAIDEEFCVCLLSRGNGRTKIHLRVEYHP